nr:phage-related protein tail component-like protein [uncultured Mediterranean phage uvMED]BAR21134.1 phage-related protein tail component-like protein [uncultured Mediterranean phage uvMED]
MIEKKHLIRGAKGNDPPPSPPQPTREPDTLHSRQYATFLDLVSEGEIEGFATASKEGRTKGTTAYNNAALKDVFLNDTPVLRSTADSASPDTTDFNYQSVTFTPRFGTGSQTKIAGIESSVSTTSVGVEVTNSTPVTRQVTNTNVDAVKVSITFPQLQKATDAGDLLGSSVELKVAVQYNSGGFTDVITDTIRGRSGDAYQKDYRVNITGSFPVDIRVSRVTADSTDTNLRDSFQWTSLGEIIDDASTYLNSAYSSIRLDSMQFSSIPARKFRIRGIKVRIPGAGASSSGTPSIDSTTGRIVYPDGYIFNGVMGAAVWTSCPAMVLLDLLTNDRYGFGAHITDSSLDLFSFVNASKFANTLVDDGAGGQEPRFSCNVNIQSPKEAFDLINDLSGVMRCMPIWSAGSITITQDKPVDPSYLFSLSNVTSEGFSYSGSSLKTRHSVVSVSYYNMDSQEVDFEVVEDATAISKIGTVVKQVKAFACTSRGQARRLGKAILFAEQNESEVVAFSTSIDSGAVVRPGAVIEIQDPVRAGVRRGGRLSAVASTTVVTADDTAATDFAVDASGNPVGDATLAVILPDGSFESRTISSVSNGVITVSSAFSQTPNVNANFLISNVTTQSQLFRVITVEEQDGINYSITALSYVEGKYAFIEDGEALPARTVSKLNDLSAPPTAVNAVERIFPINNQAVSKIVISWAPIVGVVQYQVNYRFGDENFVSEKVSRPDFEIMNSRKGTYTIQVFSYNVLDQLSASSTNITFEAEGKTALPQDVTGLLVEPVSDQFVRLRFDKATDIDVTHGGNVVVRHSNLTDGTGTFTNSVDIIPALPGNVSETLVPAVDGEYILKFRDDGGRLSSGETSIIVTTPDPVPKLLVLADREDTDATPFAGNKVDCFFSDDVNGLVLGSLDLLDGVADFDAIADFDFLGAVDITGGHYDFASTLDLGGKQPLRLTRHFVTQGFYPNDLIDKRTANVDTWTDFDGATAFDVNAKLLVATTDSDPDTSVSATYAQSGTTITITKSSHGYTINNFVTVDFTSGDGVDGHYKIQSVPSTSTFTLTAASSQTTSGNCTYSAEFSDFNTLANGTFIGRGFKFRCEMDSDDPAQSIEIDQLGYTAQLDSRTETVNTVIASGTSSKAVTFQHAFFTGTSELGGSTSAYLPNIGITIENAESGDFFALSSISGSGFTIDIKNGSSFVNRNFKYAATGFGRGS